MKTFVIGVLPEPVVKKTCWLEAYLDTLVVFSIALSMFGF